MKDFMMVFLGPTYEELGLSPEQMQARMGKWFEWSNKMGAAGILKGGDALQPGGKSISGADRVVTDGPYLEGKELIGGYFIVQANNMEEMVEIAQDFPDYDVNGTVEIREVLVFEE